MPQEGISNVNNFAICVMPWAGLRREVKIGDVRFWPWDENKIIEPDIRELLKNYLNCFVDHYNKPVKTITICSYGNKYLELLEQYEYDYIRIAINILIFSIIASQTKLAVCGNNYSAGPPTSDRYQVFGQQLGQNYKNICVKCGSTYNIGKMNEVKISKPWSLGGTFQIEPDNELLKAFDKIIKQDFPSIFRERLFRSLEWFRFAHTEADQISDTSKLVMMSTAFEILLNFPPAAGKKIYFTKQIEEKLKKDKSISKTIQYKNKNDIYTKAACWAYEFYELRNKIVHGDEIKFQHIVYRDWITYNIVADLVFWELIVNELFENNCLGEKARELSNKYKTHIKDNDSLESFFLEWTMGFEDYHRVLGWIKKE